VTLDASGPDDSWLTLRLACREPFDGAALLAFLASRAIPGVEQVTGGRYTRTIRGPDGPGLVELTMPAERGAAGRHVLLRARLPGGGEAGEVARRCRQLLDLDADPCVIAAALAADEMLAPLVLARPGLRVPGCYDGFELAVRAVLGQQVSVRGASTLTGRVAARFGTGVAETGGEPAPVLPWPAPALPWPSLVFPGPADLAGADLSGLGLTTARQATLRALATAVAGGGLVLDHGADPEQAAARLGELPGIGPWTTAYILMRAMGDADAFPGTDLGLRKALASLGADASRADRWRPWRAYAAMHLWTRLVEETGPKQGSDR
jgi:AraC family transcriptional regulator of adaptative response / DNA-3-methyladenine glycosylase II